MAINKLSAKFCETAPVGNHFDGEGLYLEVLPDGKKYWRMLTYFQGRRIKVSFGSYQKTSLLKAREKRQKAKALLDAGIHPNEHKQEQKSAKIKELDQEAKEVGVTFEQIARRLITHKLETKKATEEYCQKMLRLFEIHIFPAFGHRSIITIRGKELLDLFLKVSKKTNHGRSMTYLAKTLCQRCGEVFDFAHAEDLDFMGNPCQSIIKLLPGHDVQHMRRIEVELLPNFIKDLMNYKGHPLTKAAMLSISM